MYLYRRTLTSLYVLHVCQSNLDFYHHWILCISISMFSDQPVVYSLSPLSVSHYTYSHFYFISPTFVFFPPSTPFLHLFLPPWLCFRCLTIGLVVLGQMGQVWVQSWPLNLVQTLAQFSVLNPVLCLGLGLTLCLLGAQTRYTACCGIKGRNTVKSQCIEVATGYTATMTVWYFLNCWLAAN